MVDCGVVWCDVVSVGSRRRFYHLHPLIIVVIVAQRVLVVLFPFFLVIHDYFDCERRHHDRYRR